MFSSHPIPLWTGAILTLSSLFCLVSCSNRVLEFTSSGPNEVVDASQADMSCNAEQVLCMGICTNLQTDPNNCGTCGHSCQGGACQAGVCQILVLASGQDVPTDIAVDANY